MSQQNDYIGDDVPDDIKEIIQTKGIHRGVLEVRNIKANTELCVQTLKNLKYLNLTNIGFLIVGALLTFLSSYYFYNNDKKKYEKDMTTLIEKNDSLMHVFKKSQKENKMLLDELKNKIKTH